MTRRLEERKKEEGSSITYADDAGQDAPEEADDERELVGWRGGEGVKEDGWMDGRSFRFGQDSYERTYKTTAEKKKGTGVLRTTSQR